ncbi:PAS domain S-box-containing protein [Candidatus Kryptobacter tengchongensis]|nr:PAS domain S-box-containing protein [Candidatus Kryptobacter tengchongensis]
MGNEKLTSFGQSILEALSDVVFAVDSDYNFIYITPSCYHITGYTVDEFLSGQVKARKLVHPSDYWRLLRANYQAFKTGELPRVSEFRIIKKDGTIRWVSIYWTTVRDETGSLKYIQGVMHDITDKKLTEEKLQKSLTEFKILHSFSSELSSAMTIDEIAKTIYDHITQLIPVDGFFIDIYDEMTEQLKGLAHVYSIHGRKVMISYPNYRFNVRSHRIWESLIYEKKITYVKYSGKDIPPPFNLFIEEAQEEGYLLSAPMLSRGKIFGIMTAQIKWKGEIEEYIPIFEHIANQSAVAIERVRYFTELQESEKSLRQAYEELKKAHQQLILTEKMRTLGQLAGGIAHNLSNLLSAILGRAQLLKTKITDEALLRDLEFIEKAGQDAGKIISRLREFSKPRTHVTLVPLDVANIIEDALEITKSKWKDEAELKGIKYEISKDFPEDRLMAITNSSELREALVNIIINAIEAMPAGGKLTIGIYNVNSEKVAIYISDTGVGMDAETMARIFEPFFTTKGEYGTGLGLSIAYEIIRSHNGEIFVESELGKGSKFTIVLPASKQKVSEIVQKSELKENAFKLSVLIVDDDESVLYLLKDVFSNLGYRIFPAENGKKALEYIDAEKFDLVITDLALPDVNGWEISKATKQKNDKIPVIILTGWGIDVPEEEAKRRGADYIITKPFDLDELLLVVNTAVQSISK